MIKVIEMKDMPRKESTYHIVGVRDGENEEEIEKLLKQYGEVEHHKGSYYDEDLEKEVKVNQFIMKVTVPYEIKIVRGK